MKILFLTRRFYPDIGGVETHVMEVTKCLIEKGHSVTIVAEETSSSQQSLSATSEGIPAGATVYCIPVRTSEKQKKFVIWQWLWQHRNLIEQADIIHCHDVFFWYMPFRLRYPQKKVFTTFHGYETVYPPTGKAIRMRRLSARLSRGNIAVGDFIRRWYGTRSDFVTYGAVSHTDNAKSIDLRVDSKMNIVFVGRMAEDTGVRQYAQLLKILKKNTIDFRFTAYGEGSLKELFSELGETPGFRSDVHMAITKADVVFASSYLSMLDALNEKKLVVALYDNPLKEDYLKLSPFIKYIIAESQPDEAFKAMKFFILNPNRLRTQLKDAHEWAITQTWDQVTGLYLKLWKR